MANLSERLKNLSPAQRQLLEQRLNKNSPSPDAIAVVGMACRLPGAADLPAYWELLRQGRRAITEIPAERWDVDEFYDPQGQPGKMSTRWGAFLDDPDKFDPQFFGIAPREASRMDPQQRVLLEVAWQAFEHAGWPSDQVAGSRTGVFVGIGGTDYSKIPYQHANPYEPLDAHVGTGNALSISANRISYLFDLHGPSLAIDTACSSALVAIHNAAQALLHRECDAAIAGGVNMILTPETTIAFSNARMLSPDGHCRPFDAKANGYVRGEGCGLIVLKRLADARRDGDRILAVLRGSAVNSDGRTSGITAPNGRSQMAAMQTALQAAKLTTAAINYHEAHGTGTPLGDPIEVQALAELFPKQSETDLPCYLGSVKANIGHTETVSGVASLIKVILMMQHGELCPQIELDELNPHIQLSNSRLTIPDRAQPWETNGQPRLAGVCSYGFGGTNAVVLVEEAPQPVPTSSTVHPKQLLVLSAKTETALQRQAQQYGSFLEQTDSQYPDICYSAAVGRTHFAHRLAIPAENRADTTAALSEYLEKGRSRQVLSGVVKGNKRPKVAWLFTGQGSQYVGMGQQLYQTQPAFRAALDQCAEILADRLDRPLLSLLFEEDAESSVLDETTYTQPALFAIEYALAQMWQSWGLKPDMMLGHSVGEYVAACLAGVFSLEDGLKLIAERAKLMHQLPRNGLMAAIFADSTEVRRTMASRNGSVAVAAENGRENTVISGKAEVIRSLVDEFRSQHIRSQLLSVSHAFHSPLMDPILDDFERTAINIDYQEPTIPIVSNVTGKLLEPRQLNAQYLRQHIRQTVRFQAGMETLVEQGCQVMWEVGPSPTLLGMGRRCVENDQITWLPSLRPKHEDWSVVVETLGHCYTLGLSIDWKQYYQASNRSLVSLPSYPFERARYWLEEESGAALPSRGKAIHPLLGSEVPTALEKRLFEHSLATNRPAYLVDHQYQGSVVIPGAAYLEMAAALAQQAFGEGEHAITNLSIGTALFLPESQPQHLQLTLSAESNGSCELEIYSRAPDKPDSEWKLHASATVVHQEVAEPVTTRQIDRQAVQAECTDYKTQAEFYDILLQRGLDYGPAFRILDHIHRTDRLAIAQLTLADSVRNELSRYSLHPAVGDACMQAVGCTVPMDTDGDYSKYAYLPASLGQVCFHTSKLPEQLWVYAERVSEHHSPNPEMVTSNVYLLDEIGKAAVSLLNVRLNRVGRPIAGSTEAEPEQLRYQLQWREATLTSAAEVTTPTLVIGASHKAKEAFRQHQAPTLFVGWGEEFSQQSEDEYLLDPTSFQDWQALLAAAQGQHGTWRVLYLLEAEPTTDVEQVWERTRSAATGYLLTLVQALAKQDNLKISGLLLVTQGAVTIQEQDSADPIQAALWGLGRVAAMEHPELYARLIDLDPQASLQEQLAFLDDESLLPQNPLEYENQVAYRQGQRFVARLLPQEETPGRTMVLPPTRPLRLTIAEPGSFANLRYEAFANELPEPGQVEIEIRATGLNFSDVLKALGLYPGIRDAVVPLGIECAGVITAVGEGVTEFRAGDEVLGVAPYSFGSHTRSATYALVHKPVHLSFAEAATIPIPFLTAYYALVRLAHLDAGERVLIHAGAGGVGLAAIQIAQQLGAEIFTTAGSTTKREYLQSLGVEHVHNSRTLDFAEEIRERTARQGVDVVLNSLPGEAISKSLGLLTAYGRFLEIGKTDIYQNRKLGLLPFQDNLSYFAIDLDRMLRQRPEYIRGLFQEVMTHFEQGHYQPLPYTEFPIEETTDAFRYMSQRKNIGKVIVTAEPHASASAAANTIHADATYLLSGGLGALGLQVARWLASEGAKHLVLLSRRTPSGEAAQAIQALQQQGVNILALPCDLTEPGALQTAWSQVAEQLPPLRGIFHAAGVLDDQVLFELDQSRLDKVLAPKVLGAWQLHEFSQELPLDFFVLFSSVASLFGSPGQGNYAAANAFLDGLASYRRSQGLPALSINWGPWAGEGMAAGNAEQLESRGMGLLSASQAFRTLKELLWSEHPQAAVLQAQWNKMLSHGAAKAPPLLRELAPVTDEQPVEAVDHTMRDTLLSATPSERTEHLREFFQEQLSQIMGLPAEQLDPDESLTTLGLDSLMAIELKNNIETRLQVVLPMARFMEGPTINLLAAKVAESMEEPGPTTIPQTSESTALAESKYPLSHGQQALWYLYQLAPHDTAYNISDAVRVHGPLHREALQQAVQALVDRHPSFRTTFHAEEGRPYQQIHETWPVQVQYHEAEDWTAQRIQQFLGDEVHHTFQLDAEPLLRVSVLRLSDQEHILAFVVHHIVADFWSLVTCTAEFQHLYESFAAGNTPTLPDLQKDYTHFVGWQQEMLAQDQHWEYWQQELSGQLPVLQLPTDRPRPPVQTYHGDLAFQWLDRELTRQIKALAERNQATFQMVLLATYQVLLHRYSGQDDILVGTPTSGRTRADFAPVVGYFVNPVVVRGDLSDDPPFEQFLSQVRTKMLGALDHQDYPFPLLVEKLHPQRDPARSPLFQCLFVMQKAQIMHDQGLTPFLMGQSGASLQFADLRFESMTLDHWVAQFDLSLAASEANGGISLGWQYNTDLFDASTIERMKQHFEQLLRSLTAEPASPVSRLTLLLPEEQNQLTQAWNRTEVTNATSQLIHEQIERQAKRTPDRVAVVAGNSSLTYAELDRRANQLAHHLRAAGVTANTRVGICLPRGTDLIVAIQAVLRSGGAYVPLDPSYPHQRIEDIASSAEMKLVITQQPYREQIGSRCGEVVCLDRDAEAIAAQPATGLDPVATADDLIYVIFTSGSTGKPKGAGVYHRGFANLMDWFLRDFHIGERDRSLVITSHGFDLTQKNLYAVLAVGGQLHLSTTGVFDPAVIASQVESQQITLLNTTPSSFYSIAAEQATRLTSLRYLFLGGEPIEVAKFADWARQTETKVVNTYGPTECTDIAAFHVLEKPLEYLHRSVPIGKPISNVQLYVLDKQLQPVPQGVLGELCIGGAGLGAGYLNDQTMTAEKFITHPLAGGGSLYRTGDLCRLLPDGNVEFVGRADHQVKLRGYRVELGEIESHLEAHPAVREAVVLVREDTPGVERLVGYLVPQREEVPSAKELTVWLKERLPEYMIPAIYIPLEKMPLSPHGKLDRKALPAPCTSQVDRKRQAPQTETQRQLVRIWEELLGVSPIGVTDHFFELGGHSLLAVQLVSRVEKQFGQALPLTELLRGDTIEHLASLLDQQQVGSGWSPIVPLQVQGERPPLFCVHPAGGNVLCYHPLTQALGSDQPVYGLQSRGVQGETTPLTSLPEMVQEYSQAIRTIQAEGPYHLLGWSLGGTLAYEVARHLTQQGESVAAVCLVDSCLPSLIHLDPNDDAKVFLELAAFFKRFYGVGMEMDEQRLRSLSAEQIQAEFTSMIQTRFELSDVLDANYVQRFLHVCRANLTAFAGSHPQPSDLPVHLFLASEREPTEEFANLPDDLGWRSMVSERLSIHPVSGNHVSILTEEHVQELAHQLRRVLRSPAEVNDPSLR